MTVVIPRLHLFYPFLNGDGTRVPDIPHLASLFIFWENEVEQLDEDDAIIQRLVIPDTELGEFASWTLGKLVHAFATLKNRCKLACHYSRH